MSPKVRDESKCYLPVTFETVRVLGRVRAPVKVTLNGYTFRSTIFSMEGMAGIPLRKSNREAAGLEGGETLEVRLELDEEKREVKPPADFVKALRAAPPARHPRGTAGRNSPLRISANTSKRWRMRRSRKRGHGGWKRR
jgi:hypothetical protein